MKFCHALNGALNIERDRVHFCVAVKQNLPTIPWDPDEDLPLDRIQHVRDGLIRNLNADLDKPVDEYVAHGVSGSSQGHPCKGCRHIIDMDENTELPSSARLNCYLHLQAFTYCNAKCSYCNLRLDEGRTPLNRGRDLDHAIYKAVNQLLDADAIAPTCQVIFSSGEPSLSKDGMETLATVTRNRLPMLINTNAICFAPEIEEALKSGNAHVQVSLESGDRKSYIAVKGVDRFDSVVKNVDRYLAAVRGQSVLWIKYIVFSHTNSKDNIDKFVEFCREHLIRNVVVSANYNEGEEVIKVCHEDRPENQKTIKNDTIDFESLEAFGYLSARLELLGVNVHREYAHLTTNEQALAKAEYAKAILNALGYNADESEALKTKALHSLELATIPTDDHRVEIHMITTIKQAAAGAKGFALFGAGAHAQWICTLMQSLEVYPVVVFDNNPPEQSNFSCPVLKPQAISGYDIDTVFIASNAYHLSIYAQLKNMPEFSGLRIVDPYLDLPSVR